MTPIASQLHTLSHCTLIHSACTRSSTHVVAEPAPAMSHAEGPASAGGSPAAQLCCSSLGSASVVAVSAVGLVGVAAAGGSVGSGGGGGSWAMGATGGSTRGGALGAVCVEPTVAACASRSALCENVISPASNADCGAPKASSSAKCKQPSALGSTTSMRATCWTNVCGVHTYMPRAELRRCDASSVLLLWKRTTRAPTSRPLQSSRLCSASCATIIDVPNWSRKCCGPPTQLV
mmetsp:Transcript_13318/g.30610  ORF Transcript_13318/g.30610 Transcript_13318/m.30610 type:complete len:234 (+) Transcript_13318:428-1129(+)